MFTRVLTRGIFFPRRQSQQSEGNAKQRKAGSSRSRSPSRSPDSQEAQGVLQPSLDNVPTADKQGTVSAQEDNKVVASKSSLQNLGSNAIADDENCPVPIQSDSEHEPSGVPVYSEERSFGADEQRFSLQREDPHEVYATPPLGMDADTIQASSTVASLSSDVQTELPADRSAEYIPESCDAVTSADEEIISLSSSQTSYGMPYSSLHTGLLSDITEADEPGTREASLGRSTEDLTTSGIAQATDKGAISFSSFGSSYASTQSAETSMVLESESGSSLSTHLEEAVRDITADSMALPLLDENEDHGSVQLHPTLLGSVPASPTQTLRHAAVAEDTPSIDTAAIIAASAPYARCAASSEAADPLPEERTATYVAQAVDIPAPLTYADAMNLALQYPEMSSKILKEPLASTCSSACPTPARAVSPVREPAPTATGGATTPSSDSTREDASKDGRKQQGPAHTADRPNWALAPAEPKDARQSRPRGRGRGRGTGSASTRGSRGGQRGSWASHPSNTPPATPPNRMRQPLPAKPQSHPEPYEGSIIKEAVSARDLRKETAENWRDRVSSWREHASESSGQTTPDIQSRPTSSIGVSPAQAAMAMAGNGHTINHHLAFSKSPLNPNAPVWEYKPYRRERAATVCQTRSMPLNASPASSAPITAVPRQQPVADSNAQVENFRLMLHNCGVENKQSSMQLPTQGRAIPSSSVDRSYTLRPAASFANFNKAPAAAQGVAMAQQNATSFSDFAPRQRTQTHHSLAHRASWQGEGIQARIFPPQQSRVLEGNPAPTADPAIWRPAVPSPGIQIAPPIAQAQPPNMTMAAERVVKPLPSAGTVARSNYSVGPATAQQASSSSRAVQSASTNTQPVFNFARAGKHPGPAAHVASPSPPVGERTRPFSFDAGTVPPQKRSRFYGIETPRVVFDRSGWTVNDHP
ncbi:hypothetical protein ACG7TL_004000 [Trametes sanguinea]